MKRRTLILPILALLLIFTLAACGGNKDTQATTAPAANTSETTADSGSSAADNAKATPAPPTAAPAATDTPIPATNTPEPTATPEPEEEMTGEFARIEDVVDSYHAEGEFHYEVSATPADKEMDVSLNMTISSDWVKADNAYGSNVATVIKGFDMPQADSEDNTPQNMQMISVDDTTYLKVNDQWLSMPRDQSNEESMSMNIDDFITSMDELEKVGTETINGIKTIHYRYKNAVEFEGILADILAQQAGEEAGQYEPVSVKTSGDIWIAKKGKYAVKAETNMDGEFKNKESGKVVHIKARNAMEISNINGDITIEPPADAPKPGQVSVPGFEPGTFPIPEQTTVEGSFGGMTNLTSQLSPDEINAFYDKELPKLGWTKQGGGLMPTWTKGDDSFVLMVTPNDDGSANIVIMTNPQ